MAGIGPVSLIAGSTPTIAKEVISAERLELVLRDGRCGREHDRGGAVRDLR